jgi:hypothetical protein
LPDPINYNDIVVPSGSAQYWFFIEDLTQNTGSSASTASYVLRYAANPTTAGSTNPDPWTTYPSASSKYFPIGYVDAVSSASINQLLVRQYQRSDITSVGSGNFISMSICQDGNVSTWFINMYKSGSSV